MEIDIATIVTSAAVGAVVAAGINLIGQMLERRARRKEMLVAKAIELAIHRTDMILHLSKETGRGAEMIDSAVNAVGYYKLLDHLWRKGKLDPETEMNQEESRRG
jgi:hypothetical protein